MKNKEDNRDGDNHNCHIPGHVLGFLKKYSVLFGPRCFL